MSKTKQSFIFATPQLSSELQSIFLLSLGENPDPHPARPPNKGFHRWENNHLQSGPARLVSSETRCRWSLGEGEKQETFPTHRDWQFRLQHWLCWAMSIRVLDKSRGHSDVRWNSLVRGKMLTAWYLQSNRSPCPTLYLSDSALVDWTVGILFSIEWFMWRYGTLFGRTFIRSTE